MTVYVTSKELERYFILEKCISSFLFQTMVKICYPGIPTFCREPLSHWNLGPGNQLAKEWAKERAADSEAMSVLDNLSIFCLPVGVRSSEEPKEGINTLNTMEFSESKSENGVKAPALPRSSRSLGAFTDASFEAMKEFYNSGSTLLKGKTGVPKKQGVLSARAASMLVIEFCSSGF